MDDASSAAAIIYARQRPEKNEGENKNSESGKKWTAILGLQRLFILGTYHVPSRMYQEPSPKYQMPSINWHVPNGIWQLSRTRCPVP